LPVCQTGERSKEHHIIRCCRTVEPPRLLALRRRGRRPPRRGRAGTSSSLGTTPRCTPRGTRDRSPARAA
jgi:hypothetical protein